MPINIKATPTVTNLRQATNLVLELFIRIMLPND
jgi:hypothetical protein